MGTKKLLVLWGIVAGIQLFAQNVTSVAINSISYIL